MNASHAHVFNIPTTHPTAALHFPDLPVVPGALLLDETFAIIGAAGPLRLQAVKFLSPVRHGENIALSWREGGGGIISFEMCRPGEAVPVLTGTLEPVA